MRALGTLVGFNGVCVFSLPIKPTGGDEQLPATPARSRGAAAFQGSGRGSRKGDTTLCIPSRQLGWLEMALSPGDRCHFLLVRGGSAQPPQPRTDTFSSSGGQCWWVARGGCHPKAGGETLRTAPHLPWLPGLLLENVTGVMQSSGQRGVDGLVPKSPSLPSLCPCGPARGLSRCKEPKPVNFWCAWDFQPQVLTPGAIPAPGSRSAGITPTVPGPWLR